MEHIKSGGKCTVYMQAAFTIAPTCTLNSRCLNYRRKKGKEL